MPKTHVRYLKDRDAGVVIDCCLHCLIETFGISVQEEPLLRVCPALWSRDGHIDAFCFIARYENVKRRDKRAASGADSGSRWTTADKTQGRQETFRISVCLIGIPWTAVLGCRRLPNAAESVNKTKYLGKRCGPRVTRDSLQVTADRLDSMAPFDLDACIAQLLRKQLLHEALLREICAKTKEVLMRESNVVHVSAPVTVVGDIHG